MDIEPEAPDTDIKRNGDKTKKKKGVIQREKINAVAAEITILEPNPETKKRKDGNVMEPR